MDAIVLCWHGWRGLSRNDQAVHSGMSREVERGRFHPAPWNGAGLPAPFVNLKPLRELIATFKAKLCSFDICT